MRKQMNDRPEEIPVSPGITHDPIYEEAVAPNNHEQGYRDQEPPYQYYDQNYEGQYPGYHPSDGYEYQQNYEAYSEHYPPPAHSQIHVPPPEIQEEDGLDEKEMARLAEERLLPSQPPQEAQGSSSSRTVVPPTVPSAPPDEHGEDLYSAEDITPQVTLDAPDALGQPDLNLEQPSAPSAPTLEDLSPNHEARAPDDKQELERQRMLTEASAPSDFHADVDDNGGEGSSGVQHEPSAPILIEDDEYGGQYSHHALPDSATHREALPKYER